MGCCHICCTIVTLVIFILVTVLTLYGIPTALYSLISTQVSLEPGNIIYNAWSEGSYPISKSIYIFSVNNSDDVMNGEKPYFNEIGPFKSSILRRKTSITPSDELIEYTEVSYEFNNTDLFSLSMDESVNILNVPLLTIYYWAIENHVLETVKLHKNDIFPEGSELILEVAAKNILYKGVRICKDNIQNPDAQEICENIKKANIKMMFNFEGKMYFALFYEKINVEKTFVVNSGSNDINKIGQVDKIEGEKELAIWPNSGQCNKIDSTLGDVFPPFVEKTDKIKVFRQDICRKMTYSFKKKISGSSKAFEYATSLENPPESCYCYPENGCYSQGVIDMHECWGPHMAMSFPNFFGANQKYLTALGSMKPDKEKHESRITLDHYFGFLLKSNFKIQYNMKIKKDLDLNYKEDILFPLLWTDEDTFIPDQLNEFLIEIFYYYLFIVEAVCYGVMGLFGILCLVLILCKLCMTLWPKKRY